MTNLLATTDTGALKYGEGNGLVLVRYWAYTKVVFGEAWEAAFPDTIYLVGCSPPEDTYLACSNQPTQQVFYHRGTCSITAPSGEGLFIFSWDKVTSCPLDKQDLCGGGGEPGNNLVCGNADSTYRVCMTTEDGSSLEGPLLQRDIDPYHPGYYWYYFRGFVNPDMYVDGDENCVPQEYNYQGEFGPYTSGVMGGGRNGPWSRDPVTVDKQGHVTFSAMFSFQEYWPEVSIQVYYTGEGDVSIDPVSKMPTGSVLITVTATLYQSRMYESYEYRFCSDPPACGPEVECEAGTITVSFAKSGVNGKCS